MTGFEAVGFDQPSSSTKSFPKSKLCRSSRVRERLRDMMGNYAGAEARPIEQIKTRLFRFALFGMLAQPVIVMQRDRKLGEFLDLRFRFGADG